MPKRACRRPADGDVRPVPVEDLVAFLRLPESYPERPPHVEVRQTHMSWVFLTDRHVYKLKKPVRTNHLDFSTPEARRRNCLEELRLNRRLAEDVYCGVVPLTQDETGALALDGAGEAVDWLVKMRRLPADQTLEARIARGDVGEAEIRQLARVLARFYREVAAPVTMSGADYRQRIEQDVRQTAAELALPCYPISGALCESAVRGQLAFLRRAAALIEARAEAGHLVEGHGDLRPEHVYLLPDPRILDCLEFNRDLRLLDPGDELGYLALECERLGAGWIGVCLLSVYAEETGDRPAPTLVDFYQSYRALLRAKLAIWHLNDAVVRDAEKWPRRADHYLRLAADHASRLV